MSPRLTRTLAWALAVAALVALDQGTKYLAVERLTNLANAGPQHGDFWTARNLDGYPFEPGHPDLRRAPYVVTSFWSLRYAENPGAAWSLWSDLSEGVRLPLFYAFTLVALALMAALAGAPSAPGRRWAALALVGGGAAGNGMDRWVHGYVIDFVQWHVGTHAWPTFNLADACICAGGGLLLLSGAVRGRGSARDPASGTHIRSEVARCSPS